MKNSTHSSIKKISLPLGARSYEIYVGGGAINQVGKWLAHQPSKRAFIIADEKLVTTRAALIASLKRAKWETYEIPIRAGEELKDFHAIYPLYGELIHAKASRDSVIFALGGGSVGDAA